MNVSFVTGKPVKIVDFLPEVKTLPNGTRYGIYSASTPKRERFVRYQAWKEFEGMNETETGFVRHWIGKMEKPRARRNQAEGVESARSPLFCKPSCTEEAVYVDLKSAYQSVYSVLGWNCEYLRGRYMIADSDPLIWPYPKEWKTGRSFVVSGARPRLTGFFVKDGMLKAGKYRSPFSNPSLVCAVYDVLSSVARLAVNVFQATYYNTDGAIIPAKFETKYIETLAAFGLKAETKYKGESIVFNSSYWYVGPHLTVKMSHGGRAAKSQVTNLPVQEKTAEWVLEKFARISEARKK